MIQLTDMKKYLRAFLREKPLFFTFLRPKEASLYQDYKPFKGPVLDLGCGDGFFAQVAFGNVDVGLDPDRKMIIEAKKRKIYKIVKYYDGKKIPYSDGYFSTVVCNSTFEHIPNLDKVLHEVARVLKFGGMLYFTVPTDIWPKYLFGRLFFGKLYERYFINKSKHYNLYNFQEWKQKLSNLGLQPTAYNHYIDNKKIMWYFDISHYLSAPALLSKIVFNKWVLFPQKVKLFGWLENFIARETKKNNEIGPYLFIAVRKIK